MSSYPDTIRYLFALQRVGIKLGLDNIRTLLEAVGNPHTHCPAIHLAGTSRILRKGRTLPTPAPTRVTFGGPMAPDEGESSHRFAARIEAEG